MAPKICVYTWSKVHYTSLHFFVMIICIHGPRSLGPMYKQGRNTLNRPQNDCGIDSGFYFTNLYLHAISTAFLFHLILIYWSVFTFQNPKPPRLPLHPKPSATVTAALSLKGFSGLGSFTRYTFLRQLQERSYHVGILYKLYIRWTFDITFHTSDVLPSLEDLLLELA